MNATETKIREALEHHVGPQPLRTMPTGTRPRVRRRQARWVAGVAVMVGAATFASVAVLRSLPGPGGPADGGTIVKDDPLEFVPAGWPAVDIGNPADGYTMPPDVAGAAGGVRVIASGTVDGAGFSYESFVSNGTDSGSGDACSGFAGPGLDEFASPDPQPPGAVGGISSGTCAHAQGVPGRTDLYVGGQQDPQQAPGIVATYGFASERVDHLEVRLDDGRTVDIPLLGSPPGWNGIQAYLFFPPEGATGTLTAFSAGGTPLARAPICVANGVSGGGGDCGGPADQLTPVPEGPA
jgi:hypothetical protein